MNRSLHVEKWNAHSDNVAGTENKITGKENYPNGLSPISPNKKDTDKRKTRQEQKANQTNFEK